MARSHIRLEHCSLRSSLGGSDSPVYTVRQSAAWPGHCSSPRGCQMPGGSPHIPLFSLWLSVKPSHLASRAVCTLPRQSPPVAHALYIQRRGNGRLPAARLQDTLLAGPGTFSMFLNSSPTDIWLEQFCIVNKPLYRL